MRRDANTKNPHRSVGGILYRTVGVLLVLTLLSIWLVSGLFAKYVTSGNDSDSAHVAGTGIVTFDVVEHKAEETGTNSGVYRLLSGEQNEVKGNLYSKVLPGVDIPKDPFVKLKLVNAEVAYTLYLQVTESNPFPEYVTYELNKTLWECIDEKNGVYQYKGAIEAGTNSYTIEILKDNMLYVSEHYVGNGKFSLTFSAYLMQAKTN